MEAEEVLYKLDWDKREEERFIRKNEGGNRKDECQRERERGG